MIKEINEKEIMPFFELIGEIECGNHIDLSNTEHRNWLERKIKINYFRGAKYFGYYSENNEPIGVACLLINESLGGYKQSAELLEIGIFEKYRNLGYGSLLLKYVENIAREEKLYSMIIATYAGDYKTISFYGKNGFVPVANIPDVHGPDDEGMIFMRKILTK